MQERQPGLSVYFSFILPVLTSSDGSSDNQAKRHFLLSAVQPQMNIVFSNPHLVHSVKVYVRCRGSEPKPQIQGGVVIPGMTYLS